ncbi:MAG: hypothetical protein ACRECH_09135 [Nitrososphaerales archaeon]
MNSSVNIDYVKGQDRDQFILFPGNIEEYIDEDNAVRTANPATITMNGLITEAANSGRVSVC